MTESHNFLIDQLGPGTFPIDFSFNSLVSIGLDEQSCAFDPDLPSHCLYQSEDATFDPFDSKSVEVQGPCPCRGISIADAAKYGETQAIVLLNLSYGLLMSERRIRQGPSIFRHSITQCCATRYLRRLTIP